MKDVALEKTPEFDPNQPLEAIQVILFDKLICLNN